MRRPPPLLLSPFHKKSKGKRIDPVTGNRFTEGMNLRLFSCVLLWGLVVSGCANHPARGPQPAPPPTVSNTTAPLKPIVTPDTSLTAKVVRYNSAGRFVVLSFPVGQMPQTGQVFFLYRAGMKVGEIKITGPQRDNDTVADVTTGDAQVGDEVREQ